MELRDLTPSTHGRTIMYHDDSHATEASMMAVRHVSKIFDQKERTAVEQDERRQRLEDMYFANF